MNSNEESKSCSICMIGFSLLSTNKRICTSCFRVVCSRCSKQKTSTPDSRIEKNICDTCHSESIKKRVFAEFKIELERLKFELNSLQRRLDSEQSIGEKESAAIEDLNRAIEETKEESNSRVQEMQMEIQLLETDLVKIHADFEEVASRLDYLAGQINESDIRIQSLQEQNKIFSHKTLEEIYHDMNLLTEDINQLSKKVKSGSTSDSNCKDAKILKIKEEIIALKTEKNSITTRILEMKEVENIKESNISMLLSTLSSNSSLPDIGYYYTSYEDEEVLRLQQEEINELRSKIAKRYRKNALENNKCNCSIS